MQQFKHEASVLALSLIISAWLANNALQGYIAFACDQGHMHVAAAEHQHHCDSHGHSHHDTTHDHQDDISFDATQALLSSAGNSLSCPATLPVGDWQELLIFDYSNNSMQLPLTRAPPLHTQKLAIIKTTVLLI